MDGNAAQGLRPVMPEEIEDTCLRYDCGPATGHELLVDPDGQVGYFECGSFHPLAQRTTRTEANGRHDGEADADLADWIHPINWPEFWQDRDPDIDYVIEPLVPAGRQIALYSAAKRGKSLLCLDGCAARATGRSVFGASPREPVNIIYIDLEMTPSDLRERLIDLGYGNGDDLSRLHYFQLVDLPPLDTELGGQVLEALVTHYRAGLVVLDTMSRVVRGKEDQADTVRDFYRYTGRRLKTLGVALLRLDHAGKVESRGQRGSSGKADDVDVVWWLDTQDDIVTLRRTHSRLPWIAHEVTLRRQVEPVLRHEVQPAVLPHETEEVAALLDQLGVAATATVSEAITALRQAKAGKRRATVIAALRYRRWRA